LEMQKINFCAHAISDAGTATNGVPSRDLECDDCAAEADRRF
jgi:hypothetical protein